MTPRELQIVTRARAELKDGTARAERIAAGVKIAEVAAVLGVARTAVSQWESGRRSPTAVNALAYSRLMARLARKKAA